MTLRDPMEAKITRSGQTCGVTETYDAFLLVSFGGPEAPEEVLPFLENVTRGRGIPAERLRVAAEHYRHFGGVSPINAQNRALLAALETEFADAGLRLPLYWGNRNWHPYLDGALTAMAADGVRRALAFFTSPYSSYSGCRRYQDDLAAARTAVGASAPHVDKIRHYFNHPGFVLPNSDAVRAALRTLPPGSGTRLVFTAHSVPAEMARLSGPAGGLYVEQLRDAAALVAARAAPELEWDLVWQSRSGPPGAAWLEPDINEHLRGLAGSGTTAVVVSPIGFVSDHLEVVWDLDHAAAATAAELGLSFARASTAGTDPRFVAMVRELVEERTRPDAARRWLGPLGPGHDRCPAGCCAAPRRPGFEADR